MREVFRAFTLALLAGACAMGAARADDCPRSAQSSTLPKVNFFDPAILAAAVAVQPGIPTAPQPAPKPETGPPLVVATAPDYVRIDSNSIHFEGSHNVVGYDGQALIRDKVAIAGNLVTAPGETSVNQRADVHFFTRAVPSNGQVSAVYRFEVAVHNDNETGTRGSLIVDKGYAWIYWHNGVSYSFDAFLGSEFIVAPTPSVGPSVSTHFTINQ